MSLTEALAAIVDGAGYIAVDTDTFVSFKAEGTQYRFETCENDAGYARLTTSFSIPDDADFDRLLAAANIQNRKAKAVKTVVYPPAEDNHVSFSIEFFFADVKVWEPTFDRALGALRHACDKFFESI